MESEDDDNTIIDTEPLQCNEVSSSEESGDDEESTETENNTPIKRNSRKAAETPKLSRELSALQLTGATGSGLAISPRRGRTRSSSESSYSDTENADFNSQNSPTKQSPKKIDPKFVRSKEARVTKSISMTLPNPSTATPTTVMSLRPRGKFSLIRNLAYFLNASRKKSANSKFQHIYSTKKSM